MTGVSAFVALVLLVLLCSLTILPLPSASALVQRSSLHQLDPPLSQLRQQLRSPFAPIHLRPPSPSSPSSSSPLLSSSRRPASVYDFPFSPSLSPSSPLLPAATNCAVSAEWRLPYNRSEESGVYNTALTPACQLLYVTASDANEPDATTYVAAVDVRMGVEEWRLPFPYNQVDTIGFAPFFQLDAAGTTLYAQRLLATNTALCFEMWAINTTAPTTHAATASAATPAPRVLWKVSQCADPADANGTWAFPGGLLFPRAAPDDGDLLLLVAGSFVLQANGSIDGFVPWVSIAASSGKVLAAERVAMYPVSLLSSVQRGGGGGGYYFSLQGLNMSGNLSDGTTTAVFSMGSGGAFALQSSRTYDTAHQLPAVTAGDTLMQGLLTHDGGVESWVGWTVPAQTKRWQRSDDPLLQWEWPVEGATTVWQRLIPHPLNSSLVLATTLGSEPGGGVWAIVAVYDPHTGDRIATSDILGPQYADDEGDVYPAVARIVHTAQGIRLLQTLQEGVYVLDMLSLKSLYAGKAVKNDMNVQVTWMDGAVASRVRFLYDTVLGSTMKLNTTTSVQVD